MTGFPPIPFLGRILLRAAIVWIGFRGTLLLLFGLVVPAAASAVVIVGITTAVVFLDLRRRNELVFLGNLGMSNTVIVTLAALTPVLAELVVRVLA